MLGDAERARIKAPSINPRVMFLKPLYSFAGWGVVVGPTQAQIDDVPGGAAPNYSPAGGAWISAPLVKLRQARPRSRVRIMYLWQDQLRAFNTIVRMGRGANGPSITIKGFEWVGASAGSSHSWTILILASY